MRGGFPIDDMHQEYDPSKDMHQDDNSFGNMSQVDHSSRTRIGKWRANALFASGVSSRTDGLHKVAINSNDYIHT